MYINLENHCEYPHEPYIVRIQSNWATSLLLIVQCIFISNFTALALRASRGKNDVITRCLNKKGHFVFAHKFDTRQTIFSTHIHHTHTLTHACTRTRTIGNFRKYCIQLTHLMRFMQLHYPVKSLSQFWSCFIATCKNDTVLFWQCLCHFFSNFTSFVRFIPDDYYSQVLSQLTYESVQCQT